jgi:hypothetical protein
LSASDFSNFGRSTCGTTSSVSTFSSVSGTTSSTGAGAVSCSAGAAISVVVAVGAMVSAGVVVSSDFFVLLFVVLGLRVLFFLVSLVSVVSTELIFAHYRTFILLIFSWSSMHP